MPAFLIETRAPLSSAYRVTAIAAALAVIYTLLQIDPPPIVILFVWLAPLIAIVFWFRNEVRGTSLATVYDLGFLLYIAWPIVLPWYAFKTRGRSGWRLVLVLVGLIAAPYAAALAVGLLWVLGEWLVWFVRGGA